MLLGLLLGIVGTSLVWIGVLGLVAAASHRDDFENSEDVPLEELLLAADLSVPEWVNHPQLWTNPSDPDDRNIAAQIDATKKILRGES